MTCRIEEWESLKGEMCPMRVLNSLFLNWCVYEDHREHYAEAMEFYEQRVVIKTQEKNNEQNESGVSAGI